LTNPFYGLAFLLKQFTHGVVGSLQLPRTAGESERQPLKHMPVDALLAIDLPAGLLVGLGPFTDAVFTDTCKVFARTVRDGKTRNMVATV
jgi:hypothetical protein